MIGVQRKKQSTNLVSTKPKLTNQFGTSTLNKMLASCPTNIGSLNGFKGLKEKSRYFVCNTNFVYNFLHLFFVV